MEYGNDSSIAVQESGCQQNMNIAASVRVRSRAVIGSQRVGEVAHGDEWTSHASCLVYYVVSLRQQSDKGIPGS